MSNNTPHINEHVGERLSGYIDGELTKKERKRGEGNGGKWEECEARMEKRSERRERGGKEKRREGGQDIWREKMDDTVVTTSRGIGWLLLIGSVLAGAGIAIVMFFLDSGTTMDEKLVIGGAYLGLALLFVSVLRQRLVERKSDKYKDVEI